MMSSCSCLLHRKEVQGIAVIGCEASGKGKLRVSFDTGETCLLYRTEAYRMDIREGAVISEQAYKELFTEVLGKRAKKRALYLLGQMDRSEAALRQKLQKGEYPPSCIDDAIAYVKSCRYLDDSRYAAQLVRSCQEKQCRGQIRRRLMEKGISKELAEQALEQEYCQDEEEKIRLLLQKRHYDRESCDSKEFQRIYQYILRRGFHSSDILRVMRESQAYLTI